MGYRLQSVLGVQLTDTHRFFLYYIPGHLLETEWIDSWVTKHIDQIADSLGSYEDGVIVHPGTGYEKDFLASVAKAAGMNPNENVKEMFFDRVQGLFPKDHSESVSKSLSTIRSRVPAIIFTRTPIQVMAEGDAEIIDLTVCKDDRELSFLFDVLIKAIQKNNMEELEQLNKLERARAREAIEEDGFSKLFDMKIEPESPFIKPTFDIKRFLANIVVAGIGHYGKKK
jgi:hypothetical protein